MLGASLLELELGLKVSVKRGEGDVKGDVKSGSRL